MRHAVNPVGKLLLAMLVLSGAQQIEAAIPQRPFEGRDLFALQWASQPQIRPDGREIAYVRQSNDIMSDSPVQSLWMIDLASGEQTPMGSAPGSYSSPRWSPDGERLAYLYSPKGGPSQLWIRWMRTGAATAVTGLGESPRDIAWSPDGRSIAFTLFVPEPGPTLGAAPSKPAGATWAPPLELVENLNYRADEIGPIQHGYSHVFVVSADGGAARQLTFGHFSEAGPLSWSPDGGELLLRGNRSEGWEQEPVDPGRHLPVNLIVYRLSLSDGQLLPLTSPTGRYRAASFSPDGRHIAILGFENARRSIINARLSVLDRDGSNRHVLSDSLDRSINACQWAANGRSVFIDYTDKGITRVAQISLDGKMRPIAQDLADGDGGDSIDLPYTGGEFSAAASGAVAYIGGSPDGPPELYVVNGGKTSQLTHLDDGLFKQVQLGKTTQLPVSSSFDHRPIDAWMITPPGFDPAKKYPLILEIHGGPYLSYGPLFSTGHQLFAAAGYIVVYANPRGSTSYGEEFANLIHNDYPSHDYDDLMSVVDAAIQGGSVDPDNLFVAGHSGGGVLTAWIVGNTHRFRAAASLDPIINWSSGMLESDIAPFVTRYWFDAMPWEAPETYWKHSPLSLVGNVTTPTLMVVGSRDLRTPVGEAEQFYEALQLRKVPTALIKVPGAFHSITHPSQFAARSSAILAWFARYKSGAAR
jgi:dipeptidyl aminopeptidase/acylaminoacyl peptidase